MAALLEEEIAPERVSAGLPRFAVVPQTRSAEMLDSEVLDPRADDRWDRALADHASATIFHSSAWAKVLCETYGHKPLYLRASDATGTTALLPLMEVASPFTGKRGVSLPFSDFCEPLNFTASITERACVIAREREWKYLELRGANSEAAGASATFYAHTVDLVRPDLFERCSSAFRRALRKAERSGLAIEVRQDAKALREFYRLHARTRRRHGVPPQPFLFFEKIRKHILAPGLGFIGLAFSAGRPVAGAIFFHYGAQAVFKFGASDERHQAQRASNLVMWEGMQECVRRGLTTLHLGRTDRHHDGLRRFKLSLGAEEKDLHYSRFHPEEGRWTPVLPANPAFLPGAVFRSLPLTVNQLAGTMLYRHLH